ncbi:serine threonine kinase [Fusarium heterosporum]|uniref:Serine threonine kinase n=1 Tax=Fusarium heterosporum TaxID=42747 RepID=A0A8H5WKQ6_FUSHE|nr:serine threonine kinase [Fusarium heterosporum]
MLALPNFLRLFLYQDHDEYGISELFDGFDDLTLLKATQEQKAGNRDTFSLLSRLIRNGPRYCSDVEETLAIFKEQRKILGNASSSEPSGEALCMQIRLGNRDIVGALLKMGHNPSGSHDHRPMCEAIILNDEKYFPFKELLEQRTETSLSILRSLIIPNDTTSSQRTVVHHTEQLDFIVDNIGDPTEQQSVWTILAASPPARKNVVEAEIYMAQVQCMLSQNSPFATRECINFDHPKLGTALCRAALFQNHFLIGKLLRSGADPNIRFRQNFGPAQRYFGDGSPINLALGCYEVAIEGWSEIVPDSTLEDMQSVINELESIPDYPEEALTRGEALRKRHEDILRLRDERWDMQSHMASMSLEQRPVDLSNISAVQAPEIEEGQREMFQATETIIRWMFDSQRYGTIGRAQMARIAEGENA